MFCLCKTCFIEFVIKTPSILIKIVKMFFQNVRFSVSSLFDILSYKPITTIYLQCVFHLYLLLQNY